VFLQKIINYVHTTRKESQESQRNINSVKNRKGKLPNFLQNKIRSVNMAYM
jgi:hypothetical protein